jgi:aryl-alcohol dehydrogenase-like predicted oxidoreductase/histidinol phosphatase-like enzyme/predicted kinase
MNDARTIAIGCMRLSTDPDRDDDRSVDVLHVAFDAGVTLLDTADAYCLDETDVGHNERLIALALATWSGDRSRITIATKGGMTRPEGRWEPDGRAKHLRTACERSCQAMGVERIALYQLHAPDPRTPLSTSVRALAGLKRDGLIAAIGLSNVTVGQIEEARRITEITSIQVELSVWNDASLLSGVVAYCLAHRLQVLAYRPLGGRRSQARTKNHPVLQGIAAAHGVSPFDIAIAWLVDLPGAIVPLPGVTRVETAAASARAQQIVLTDADRRLLDDAFPSARLLRGDRTVAPPSRHDAEVVIVMGLPGAGKTTLTERFVAEGYQRINRDELGGTLRALTGDLDRALAAGISRIVLDNTYGSRRSRAEVLHTAAAHRVPVRCIWLTTSVDQAQVNAVSRLLLRYGRLPADEDLVALRKQDASAFLPTVQFRYQRELEPPDDTEGFAKIEALPFVRKALDGHTNRAVIVWCDDVLLRSKAGHRTPVDPDDVVIDEVLAAALRRDRKDGHLILGLSWQPEIAEGTRTAANVAAVFERMNALMGFSIEVEYCPHPAGPPSCWCRKPLPGLGVLLMHRHRLDPARSVYVGGGAADPGFASKLGLTYRHHDSRRMKITFEIQHSSGSQGSPDS